MTNSSNEVKCNEIRIKQDRLRALLSIESLFDVVPSEKVDSVDKKSILEFSNGEKTSLVLDIVNSLNITEFDTSFYEANGGNGYHVDCTVEESIDFLVNHNDSPIIQALYDEFVFVVANYDMEDLMDYEIPSKYLKMISVTQMCYEDLGLESCEKIS